MDYRNAFRAAPGHICVTFLIITFITLAISIAAAFERAFSVAIAQYLFITHCAGQTYNSVPGFIGTFWRI